MTKDKFNNRKYIRLKSAFPVDFTAALLSEDVLGLDWQQGYTCNVSSGGICLETVHLSESALKYLNKETLYLDLRIRIPLTLPPIKAVAEVAWFEKINDDDQELNKYMIGLRFHSILDEDLRRIMNHARWFRFSARTLAGIAGVLFLAFGISCFHNYGLRRANERLINNLVETQQQEIKIAESLKDVLQEKEQILDKMIRHSQDVVQRQPWETKYWQVMSRKKQIKESLKVLEYKKQNLQNEVVDKMHLWMKNHQNPSTGLVLSFEGDVDVVKHWAFIYDQALAVNVFLNFDNIDGARDVLNFFQRNLDDDFQGFPNAYYYDSEQISEFAVHCGPNIWIGIAIMQYMHMTGTDEYLPMARKIADWLITIQDADPAGGLKGGPKFTWFATEHNLDAYALFTMLYAKTQDDRYRIAQAKALSWLKIYAMIPHDKNYPAPPVNRGRGDATIATDTFAWSLATLGPQKLQEIGMDPEQIMNFAEEHCAVKINYQRPGGEMVKVNGFDFSKPTHIARGGMVSPEWTSQMVISFQMLSEYFLKNNDAQKARVYEEKSRWYLGELNKLIISSPSARGQGEGCLPYATLANADTGHGWNTPMGASTCSIAGTAYMILAIKQFNPLMLSNSNE